MGGDCLVIFEIRWIRVRLRRLAWEYLLSVLFFIGFFIWLHIWVWLLISIYLSCCFSLAYLALFSSGVAFERCFFFIFKVNFQWLRIGVSGRRVEVVCAYHLRCSFNSFVFHFFLMDRRQRNGATICLR
ncbi:hypothetical protein BGX38DRAFT_1193722 [Terfezia claveryi]|nr:hypothetical protein BGX38DRAFT_1243364 [Terfezia claveryi]KAF8446645.1 hypothetical protein BGX38DRAFT_1193722 [Terfezia claveryi]